jgi:hypothetical protein
MRAVTEVRVVTRVPMHKFASNILILYVNALS